MFCTSENSYTFNDYFPTMYTMTVVNYLPALTNSNDYCVPKKTR